MKNIVSYCCGVRRKKVHNDISATAAAECIASDWPMTHYIFPRENPPLRCGGEGIFQNSLTSCFAEVG